MLRIALLLLSVLLSTAMAAQAVGTLAPPKSFLATWNLQPGITDLWDLRLPNGTPNVVILDWFGVN